MIDMTGRNKMLLAGGLVLVAGTVALYALVLRPDDSRCAEARQRVSATENDLASAIRGTPGVASNGRAIEALQAQLQNDKRTMEAAHCP